MKKRGCLTMDMFLYPGPVICGVSYSLDYTDLRLTCLHVGSCLGVYVLLIVSNLLWPF
jgi:hypothetical protein